MNLKRQIIIISVISGIIALALALVFIYPLLKELRQTSLDIINVKKELALFDDKTGGIDSIKQTYKNIETDLEKIDDLFVNPEVPIDLIKFWEQTAIGSGVSIKITPISSEKEKKEDGALNFIMFRLTLTGSFVDFLRFFEKIEAGFYLIEIQDLSIKRLTGYGDFPINNITSILTVKVFTK